MTPKIPNTVPHSLICHTLICLSLANVQLAADTAELHAPAYDLSSSNYEAPSYADSQAVPLTVYIGSRGEEQLVKATDEGIEIEMDAMGGLIAYPWDNIGQLQINTPVPNEIQQARVNDDPAQKARDFKAFVQPLAPFAGLPEGSTNIHSFIETYLEATIDSGNIEDSLEFSQRLSLNRIPRTIALPLYKLSEQLLLDNRQDEALSLINQLRAARPAAEFQEMAEDLARNLLEKRLFESAYGLYQPLFQNAEPETKQQLAWDCAYLALVLNQDADYKRYRSIAEASTDATNADGVPYLLDGIAAVRDENFQKALDQIGHALALVETTGFWKEIALYYNYLAYSGIDEVDIAQTILAEMDMVFSSGAYTQALHGEPSTQN